MSCCCKKVYRICDAILCDGEDLVLPIPVSDTGTHRLVLDFLGGAVFIDAAFESGQSEMRFDKSELNESFTYTGHVKDPSGAIVLFTIDEVEYDCIEFTTKRLLSLTNNESES